jgi:hypothetical protein
MVGTRGIWENGWKASAVHPPAPSNLGNYSIGAPIDALRRERMVRVKVAKRRRRRATLTRANVTAESIEERRCVRLLHGFKPGPPS